MVHLKIKTLEGDFLHVDMELMKYCEGLNYMFEPSTEMCEPTLLMPKVRLDTLIKILDWVHAHREVYNETLKLRVPLPEWDMKFFHLLSPVDLLDVLKGSMYLGIKGLQNYAALYIAHTTGLKDPQLVLLYIDPNCRAPKELLRRLRQVQLQRDLVQFISKGITYSAFFLLACKYNPIKTVPSMIREVYNYPFNLLFRK